MDFRLLLAARAVAAERVAKAVPALDGVCVPGAAGRVPGVFAFDFTCADSSHSLDALTIDSGGNDTYGARTQVIVDIDGDDVYTGANGGARVGIGFLFDVRGNDRYLGQGVASNGAGREGVGFLFDGDGHDVYVGGGSATNGAGSGGVGFLFDGGGDDTYTSNASCGNGCGSLGSGVLVDGAGRDRYETLGGSGNGAGVARGTGVLMDFGGDDRYVGRGDSDQYAGQRAVNGAADFAGTGLLFDASGDDVYDAEGVGNGAAATFEPVLGIADAVHGSAVAVGGLVDLAGADDYRVDVVGVGPQLAGAGNGAAVAGAGLALRDESMEAFGFLFDGGPEGDAFTATGDADVAAHGAALVVSGAGGLAAQGVLVDAGGPSRYEVAWSPDSTTCCPRFVAAANGAAVLRRGVADAQSIGALLDGGGADTYTVAVVTDRDGGLVAANGASRGSGPDDRPASETAGVALLVDAGDGRDAYVVDAAMFAAVANGAAADSAHAALVDGGGDDERTVAAQGGFANGAGHAALLLDLGGNDDNEAAFVAGDDSLANGAGAHVFHVDLAGDDRYGASTVHGSVHANGVGATAEPFAPPPSTGVAVSASDARVPAILYDAAGNDHYVATTHGSGVAHANGVGNKGFGLLLDETGDDDYDGAGVTQGAGQTGGVGVLIDGGGRNTYTAGPGIAQGTGRDLGTGILIDHGHTTSFTLRDGTISQGNGLGGVGVLARTDPGGATEYFVAPGAEAGVTSGNGVGLRVDVGRTVTVDDVGDFSCRDAPEVATVGDPAVVAWRFCGHSEASKRRLVNPGTGDELPDLSKPAAPCAVLTAAVCSVVEAALGPGAPAWLARDHVTATMSGGVLYVDFADLNGAPFRHGRSFRASADETCDLSCARLDQPLAIT